MVGFIIGAYLIYLSFLFLRQETLIFQRFKPNLLRYKKLRPISVNFKASDGTSLQGWHLEKACKEKTNNRVLIYFGGNAQDTSEILPILEKIHTDKIYTFNYRGYGLSGGIPSEKKFYQDSADIINRIKQQHKSSQVILMGYSLGSAIAGAATSQTSPSKLILVCPIHSIKLIAKERYYIPGILIRHGFCLKQIAKNITTPTLAVLAAEDSTIPKNHSLVTFNSLESAKELKIIKNSDHKDIFENTETIDAINSFLNSNKNGR